VTRVLVTGGAGTIGRAVVRRLVRDPRHEVRVSDQREAPDWMREACEVHTGNLLDPLEAAAAADGRTHVIHLAAIVGGIANFHRFPHTLLEVNTGLYNSVFRAALEHRVERLVYVSSSMVFERATEFPTTEEHLDVCPPPHSATAGRCTTSTGCPSRSAGPSMRTGPASCPTTSRGSLTRCRT
jgi:UDP-glucose 4-epimerase